MLVPLCAKPMDTIKKKTFENLHYCTKSIPVHFCVNVTVDYCTQTLR